MKQIKGITLRDNKWQVRTTYKGQKIYRQFSDGEKATHTLARRYLQEEKKRIDMGQYYEEHKTLEEVYLFLDREKRETGRKKEQSSIVTDNLFYNHIAVSLNKNRYIDTFTQGDIMGFNEDVRNSGLKASMQGRVINLLKQIYKTAMKHKWVAIDHTVLIDCPSVIKGKNKVFTEEQTRLLYEMAERRFNSNPNILGIVSLGLYGGLRLGEMIGLRWKDIDFENHELHVTEQFHTTLHKYTETKTRDSTRTLGMLPPFELSLKRIYDRARKQAGFKDTHCILTGWKKGYTGKPLGINCIYETLGRLTVACGLPRETRVHVLRKTCGTNMLNNGYSLPEVSAWLGHSKSNITWEVYTNKDSVRKETYNKMYQKYLQQKGA